MTVLGMAPFNMVENNTVMINVLVMYDYTGRVRFLDYMIKRYEIMQTRQKSLNFVTFPSA